jgi:hypothetical protein
MVHGASSTIFLRIEGTRLKEFASVDTGDELLVAVTNNSGKERILRREKMNSHNFEEVYRRYSSYDPAR